MTLKENGNAEILLEDQKPVLEEPVSSPETPRANEDAQTGTDWEARDKMARDRVLLKNEEKKGKRQKFGHFVY